ncbi:MAG: hypothetical protein Q8936_21260 [Bacillota bacterium]|nr:hypothetical protein [Bacillota bacterium]
MDTKKEIKMFINYVCDWVEYQYRKNGHNGFVYNLRNNLMPYLIADKGIEKRISKQLNKRLGLKTKVEYTLIPPLNKYSDGELKIKILRDVKSNDSRRIKKS